MSSRAVGDRALDRRTFLILTAAGAAVAACADPPSPEPASGVAAAREGEDLFAWLARTGQADDAGYRRVLGWANPFKEGDAAQGIAAPDEASRALARTLLGRTRIEALLARPVFEDELSTYIDAAVDRAARAPIAALTMAEWRTFLLEQPESAIHAVLPGLTSDLIALTVKQLSNDDLIAVGRKLFHPLPGSKVGAAGYLGARIQPNSPTDHPDDILFQVLDGFAYAVGDVVLGTNPVSSEVGSVALVEDTLREVLTTFGLTERMPHCVLAHVDVQAKVEEAHPGSTALWFQSLAGVADANTVFDIDVAKMRAHAAKRSGKYGLYFETGQGADGTNGHGKGFDMVIHESRKYGFARALKAEVAAAQTAAGREPAPWVHVNDVAGFIGPEVFRTKEQLVRVCLEDTVMGKLHGLCIGLDICSTLHMEVTLDDLDWCIDQVVPANPAYLMALPTKNDPMLSYLTTSFQDHVRIREKFGYKVDDAMWAFFRDLGVIDAAGKPTEHFGDPAWVFLKYRRAAGDPRPDAEILAEAGRRMAEVEARGVFLAKGHGAAPWDLEPALDAKVRGLYHDAKQCIHAELPAEFAATVAAPVAVATQSKDRHDYILHPPTGEVLAADAVTALEALRASHGGTVDVQIVLSDGLDALALTDEGHLAPFLRAVRNHLVDAGYSVAKEHIVVTAGRVRAGYRIGEILFGKLPAGRSAGVLHVIGERPGNGHHTYSVYVTGTVAEQWAKAGAVDHNVTAVVANIADTALDPTLAAADAAAILARQMPRPG